MSLVQGKQQQSKNRKKQNETIPHENRIQMHAVMKFYRWQLGTPATRVSIIRCALNTQPGYIHLLGKYEGQKKGVTLL